MNQSSTRIAKFYFPLRPLLTACVIVHAITKFRLQTRRKLMLKNANNKTWEVEWKVKYLQSVCKKN